MSGERGAGSALLYLSARTFPQEKHRTGIIMLASGSGGNRGGSWEWKDFGCGVRAGQPCTKVTESGWGVSPPAFGAVQEKIQCRE